MCVCVSERDVDGRRMAGVWKGPGRLSMVLNPPGGAEWSYFQAPVHLLPWQQRRPRCCHGEVDTKRRGVGTGPGVRSEGQGSRVTASWTAHKRRPGWEKKEGRFAFLSPFRPFFSGVLLGRETSAEWTLLDINIEPGGEMKNVGEVVEGEGGVRRAVGSTGRGPPLCPGSGRLPCIGSHTYWCLIAHCIWQAIDSGQCTRKCDYWEAGDGCVCVRLCGRELHSSHISGTQRRQKAIGQHFIPVALSSKLLRDNETDWKETLNQYFAQHGKTDSLHVCAPWTVSHRTSLLYTQFTSHFFHLYCSFTLIYRDASIWDSTANISNSKSWKYWLNLISHRINSLFKPNWSPVSSAEI